MTNSIFREALPQGEEIHDAVRVLCATKELPNAHLLLQGVLENVSVEPEPRAELLTLSGPLYLIAAEGDLLDGELRFLWGTVSWSDRGIPRVAAGLIKEAEVLAVSALVQEIEGSAKSEPKKARGRSEPKNPAEPQVAKREPEAEVRRPQSKINHVAPEKRKPQVDSEELELQAEMAVLEKVEIPEPKPAPVGAGGWGAVVAASRATKANPGAAQRFRPSDLGFESSIESELQPGDFLVHPQFGRCRVVKAPQGGKVSVRRASGGFYDLVLKIFQITRLPDESGDRVFRLSPSK